MKSKFKSNISVLILAIIFLFSGNMLYSQEGKDNSVEKKTEVTKNLTLGSDKEKGKSTQSSDGFGIEVGLKGGFNFSYIITSWFSDVEHSPSYQNMPLYMNWNFNTIFGADVLVNLSKTIDVELDLFYATRGGTFRGINTHTQVNHLTYKLNYLTVAGLLRYNLVQTTKEFPLKISFGIGPYIGYLLNSSAKVRVIDNGMDTDIENREIDASDLFNVLDVGLSTSFGISYAVDESIIITLDTRYNLGFFNARDLEQAYYQNEAFDFMFGLNYKLF